MNQDDIRYLRGCEILDNGSIDPYGCIYIAPPSYKDLVRIDRKRHATLTLWSPRFYQARSKRLKAKLGLDSIQLLKGKKVIEIVPFSEIKRVRDLDDVTVTATGYATFTSVDVANTSRLFKKALAGIDPGSYDNGRFAQVDPAYRGSVLVKMVLEDEEIRMFTRKGAPVEILAYDAPLSFERWGQVLNPPQISNNRIFIISDGIY